MKIVVSEFVSLDGVMESPGGEGNYKYKGWTMPYVSDTFLKFKRDELFAADGLLVGRVTYEIFASAWPKMPDTSDFGERMNNLPKYVLSHTLKELSWNNSRLITLKEIPNLKQAPGRDILVFGSGMLSEALMEQDLIDEYRLLIYPVVLGEGKRLLRDGVHATLELTETRPLDKGVVLVRYIPAGR